MCGVISHWEAGLFCNAYSAFFPGPALTYLSLSLNVPRVLLVFKSEATAEMVLCVWVGVAEAARPQGDTLELGALESPRC